VQPLPELITELHFMDIYVVSSVVASAAAVYHATGGCFDALVAWLYTAMVRLAASAVCVWQSAAMA
jgi:hypothetical protein